MSCISLFLFYEITQHPPAAFSTGAGCTVPLAALVLFDFLTLSDSAKAAFTARSSAFVLAKAFALT
jgi:hypothetical protein